ncbi:hypothetical protein QBC44DRAFT_371935 [Cladorrhinum sp. PSN332]|nr:hypothetical protein QBC44DRAFT_371935 [Cladorrhinum sp. PSN332]
MPDSDSSTPSETSSLLPSHAQQDYASPKSQTSTNVNNSNPDTSPSPASKPNAHPPPPPPPIPKADTDLSWGEPAGLPIPPANDENLLIFRRAVGINAAGTAPAPPSPSNPTCSDSDPRSLEECRRVAKGMYLATIKARRRKARLYGAIATLIYLTYFFQILVGASLTALGPSAGDHEKLITALGAINTVLAGVLALLKGQGFPGKLKRRAGELRKLQDWIEQTEALLAVGVIGRDRKEVGLLVQVAFKKYNAAKESEPEVGVSGGEGYQGVVGSFVRVQPRREERDEEVGEEAVGRTRTRRGARSRSRG